MNNLECKRISKSFGSTHALKEVSFTAKGGEILALLGGNGSGKSTLSKILGGTVRKDTGEILLGERTLKIDSPTTSKKNGIIVTSQELSLIENFDVGQNITMSNIPAKGIFVNKKVLFENALKVLKKMNMERFLHYDINSLTANQKYMVEFAKAIIQNPKVLIVDEITSALFREDVKIVQDILFELKAQGCIVILITHRMNEIFEICDKVTVMRNGEYIGTYDTNEIDEHHLLYLMTGHDVKKAVTKAFNANLDEENVSKSKYITIRNHKLHGFDSLVNLEIGRGEIIGVAGLQGQGQSHLVRELFAINRTMKLDIEGREVEIKNARDAVKNKFAFISGNREQEGTFSNRSIIENASVVSDLILSKKTPDKEGAMASYKVKMKNSKQPIRALSGGNQQKVVLARWTITNPELILADDPTKGIDVNARTDVHNILIDLANKGMSLLYVSSDEEELVEFTGSYPNSKIIVMYGGEIVKILTGEEKTKENIALYQIPTGGITK